MARSSNSQQSRTRVVVRQSYYWPDQQLNLWIIIMLATGGVLIGVFAAFVRDQQQFGLGIPWFVLPSLHPPTLRLAYRRAGETSRDVWYSY